MQGSEDIAGHLTTEELFRLHAGFVTRFLTRFGVPSEELDDALQEVFLVVHRNGGYRPGVAKPTSYLANIAIRAAAAHRRRQGGVRRRHSEAAVEALQGDAEDPGHALQVREDLHRLHNALAGLPEDLRAVLVLVEIEGESCLSVAAGLGCPAGTIYWRLHQARKKLQSALASVGVAPRGLRHAAAEPNQRALPARSLIMMFGLDRFNESEAGRLLQRARPPSAQPPLAAQLERHQQLVASGAELPAWAASYVPHTTSWLGLLGAGPITAGLTLAGAVVAVGLLTSSGEQPRLPAPSSLVVTSTASAERKPPSASNGTAAEQPAAEASGAALGPPHVGDRAAPPRPNAATASPAPASTLPDVRALGVRGADVMRKPAVAANRHSNAARGAALAHGEDSAPNPSESAQTDRDDTPATGASAPVQTPNESGPARPAPDKELAEMREIAQAERLLPRDPARALALTQAMQRRFPGGYFREERAYVEVMALAGLGRRGELREKAAAFLGAYPNGPYSERVKRTVAR